MRLIHRFLSCLLFVALSAHASVDTYLSGIQHDPKKLDAFFTAMPKGGELHYHLDGGADAESMLSMAAFGRYCLDKEQRIYRGLNCKRLPVKNSPEYRRIIRAWSMQDFVSKTETSADHFFSTFSKFGVIAADYKALLLAETMRRAASQHALYLEVMVMFMHNQDTFTPDIESVSTWDEKRRILLKNAKFQSEIAANVKESDWLLAEARKQLGCTSENKKAVCQLRIAFQYVVEREIPLNASFVQALAGFETAARTANVVAVNIMEREDGVLSLRNYRAHMAFFNYLHRQYPNVHITLHAGELSPQIAPKRALESHIRDAVFIGQAERIGHGVVIKYAKDPIRLASYMANKPIPVEINLSSNEKILGIQGMKHPFLYYLKYGVPVVLSTDDEGVLRTELSKEFVKAFTMYHLDYAMIKNINRNTLTYSFLPGKSIWSDPTRSVLREECRDLYSKACRTFVKTSPKASLQWELEDQLIAFERNKTFQQRTGKKS